MSADRFNHGHPANHPVTLDVFEPYRPDRSGGFFKVYEPDRVPVVGPVGYQEECYVRECSYLGHRYTNLGLILKESFARRIGDTIDPASCMYRCVTCHAMKAMCFKTVV
jgi:hypothetical protein